MHAAPAMTPTEGTVRDIHARRRVEKTHSKFNKLAKAKSVTASRERTKNDDGMHWIRQKQKASAVTTERLGRGWVGERMRAGEVRKHKMNIMQMRINEKSLHKIHLAFVLYSFLQQQKRL